MAEANDTAGIIYQNLLDAGCDQQTTDSCMALVKKGSYAEMIPILSRYRAAVLETVRFGQKQIDCLDYLMYQINKEQI